MEVTSLKELEDISRQMVRKAINCLFSTPTEAGHLDLGLLPLSCIVKEMKVNYSQYNLKSDQKKTLYTFFEAQ